MTYGEQKVICIHVFISIPVVLHMSFEMLEWIFSYPFTCPNRHIHVPSDVRLQPPLNTNILDNHLHDNKHVQNAWQKQFVVFTNVQTLLQLFYLMAWLALPPGCGVQAFADFFISPHNTVFIHPKNCLFTSSSTCFLMPIRPSFSCRKRLRGFEFHRHCRPWSLCCMSLLGIIGCTKHIFVIASLYWCRRTLTRLYSAIDA